VGTCPGREESAEVSKNNRSPKGNRMMRRVLNQVAHAAVKTKGNVFQEDQRRSRRRHAEPETVPALFRKRQVSEQQCSKNLSFRNTS
jgi:hypothetical protein